MSDRRPRKTKIRRRRNDDPVKEQRDGRIAYWTGGKPGLGNRKFSCGPLETQPERAAALREMLRADHGVVPRPNARIVDVAKDMMQVFADKKPDGSLDAYRSDLNNWILPVIGDVACAESGVWCLTAVLDEAIDAGRMESSVKRLAGTLGTLASFGALRGYWADRSPFGPEVQVREARKQAFLLVRGPDAYGLQQFTTADVPTWADVEVLAAAFEAVYPGRGAAVVRVMAACGMRPAEFLAVKVEYVHLEQMTIDVHWQLRRKGDWPERRRAKGRRRRTVKVWDHVEDDLRLLVELAQDGWLVPPSTDEQHKWLASFDDLMKQACKACNWGWVLYFLRHHFASWCLQSVEDGGYGYSLETVAHWLGHTSCTQPSRQLRLSGGRHDTDSVIVSAEFRSLTRAGSTANERSRRRGLPRSCSNGGSPRSIPDRHIGGAVLGLFRGILDSVLASAVQATEARLADRTSTPPRGLH